MSGVVAYYGGMVKNGLTIYLDASKRTSAQTFQNPIVGTKWRDLSGNANDVTFSGSVVYNQNFNSFTLDGSTTYMFSDNLFPIEGPATIGILCRPTATGNRNFVTISNASGPGGGFLAFQLGYDATTSNALSVWKYGGTILASGGVLTTSNWVYICVSYSTTAINTYINGVLTTTVSSPSLQTGLGRFIIGTYRHLPSPLQVMSGDVNMCHYYNRTLSSTEITQNFNAIRSRYNL